MKNEHVKTLVFGHKSQDIKKGKDINIYEIISAEYAEFN